MSVVLLGGNKCMKCEYGKICKKYNMKSKFFNTMEADMERRIGNPDRIILFLDCSSHKLLRTATKVAKKKDIEIVHVRSSSKTELEKVVSEIA